MALISWLEKKIVYHKDWPINKSQESKKIDESFKPNQTQGYLIKKIMSCTWGENNYLQLQMREE